MSPQRREKDHGKEFSSQSKDSSLPYAYSSHRQQTPTRLQRTESATVLVTRHTTHTAATAATSATATKGKQDITKQTKQTMKHFLLFSMSDSTVDLLTGVMVIGVTSFVLGLRTIGFVEGDDEDSFVKFNVPNEVHFIFNVLVGLIAMFNLTGSPSFIVDQHWEKTIFGNKFFPTKRLTIPQKRVLAGIIELVGLLLCTTTASSSVIEKPPDVYDVEDALLADDNNTAKIRAIGYGIIFVMYGRGAMINSQIYSFGGSTLATLLVSVTALFQFTAELQNDLMMSNYGTTANMMAD